VAVVAVTTVLLPSVVVLVARAVLRLGQSTLAVAVAARVALAVALAEVPQVVRALSSWPSDKE
jgi:uncharacterized membrane protein YGL010W